MPEPSHRYRASPSAPPPASPRPQRRPRYRERPKPSSETSTVLDSVNDVGDPYIALLSAPEAEGPSVPDESKLSPIIELINKRLKTTSKKIARIESYASTDPQHLNADQKRFMRTLPTQLAIQKELSDVKRAIEAQEADPSHDPVAGTLELEEVEGADTIAAQVDAVPPELYSQLRETCVTKTIDLLDLLRYSLLTSGKLDTLSPTEKTEGSIIDGVADALLGMDDEKRRATVKGFLQGSGDFDGLSYTLLIEISKAGLALHRGPTTPPPAVETQEVPVAEPETVADVIIAGIPEGLPNTRKINFVQESELGSLGTSGGRLAALERGARGRTREGAERKEVDSLSEGQRVAPVQVAAAGDGQKKREVERHRRGEGEQRQREPERQKEQRKRDKDKEQRWMEEWQQVEQLNRSRAEKGETSWMGLEMQSWEDEKSVEVMEQKKPGGRKATKTPGAQRQRGKTNRTGNAKNATGTPELRVEGASLHWI